MKTIVLTIIAILYIHTAISAELQFDWHDISVNHVSESLYFIDCNNDNFKDIVLVSDEGIVTFLVGDGSGDFAEYLTVETHEQTSQASIADFNTDGRQDILIGNSLLLTSDSGGYETVRIDTPLGDSAAGDIDGDGVFDIATVIKDDADYEFSIGILLGNGDGTFGEMSTSKLPDSNYTSIVMIGRITDDSIPDIMTRRRYCVDEYGMCGKIAKTAAPVTVWKADILPGNGDGTFGEAITSRLYGSATACDDVNGDGYKDLLVNTWLMDDFSVHLSDGNGIFQRSWSSPTNEDGRAYSFMFDADGDDNPDVAMFSRIGWDDEKDGKLQIFRGRGDGDFDAPSSMILPDISSFTHHFRYHASDITGNGLDDLIIVSEDHTSMRVYLNKGFSTLADNQDVDPTPFTLHENYPNPFNPVTSINYTLNRQGLVQLTVYDVIGRTVKRLIDKHMAPGSHSVDFDGSGLPSGVYYFLLDVNGGTQTGKMLLLK